MYSLEEMKPWTNWNFHFFFIFLFQNQGWAMQGSKARQGSKEVIDFTYQQGSFWCLSGYIILLISQFLKDCFRDSLRSEKAAGAKFDEENGETKRLVFCKWFVSSLWTSSLMEMTPQPFTWSKKGERWSCRSSYTSSPSVCSFGASSFQ